MHVTFILYQQKSDVFIFVHFFKLDFSYLRSFEEIFEKMMLKLSYRKKIHLCNNKQNFNRPGFKTTKKNTNNPIFRTFSSTGSCGP